mmetsp:Transcript_50338/g.113123  ORF Transcript_50338/g.113123 Transcript_50338/m.113123 type:complete len:301 (-) Transcript_50338:168-1070(-)
MDAPEDDTPRPPPSPFVARLRTEVAESRQWDHQPSVASWLTPRGTRRRVSEVRGVRFEDEVRAEPAPIIALRFKGSASKPFRLDGVSADVTVRDVKMLCESTCSLNPDQQRMLYKGKILQDNHTLEEAGLPDGATIFLVRGPSGRPDSQQHQRMREREEEEVWHRREREAAALLAGPPCLDCGVNPGRLQTDGLCSICFREQVVKENRMLKKRREEAKRREQEAAARAEQERKEAEERELRSQQDVTRCYQCRKKIGLTGFRCQCGYTFCAAHRHAEDHACTFDHKAHGREVLARQNAAA